MHHCVAAFISDVAPVGTPIAAHAASGFKLGKDYRNEDKQCNICRNGSLFGPCDVVP